MKKKYLVTTVAMLAAVSMLAACGNKDNNDVTPTTTPTPTVTFGYVTETPAPTEAPAATVDHKQMVNNMYQAVVEAYGSTYSPSMQMQNDEFYMTDTLKLDASWYDHAIVDVMGMAVLPDTFILIHPTEGNLENVKNALEAYKTTLTENAWYPTTVTRSKGAQTGVAGDYVYFVVLTGTVDDMAYETEEQVIEACKESTQLAVNTIAGVVSGEITVEPWTEIDLVRNAIVKMYGDTYYPNMKIHEDEAYLGTYMADTLKLDAAWVSDIVIEVPMISANVDTLVLVKPSEGNAENVLTALNNYKTYLVEETNQYPFNVARVKTALVQQVGDYVCFVILGGALDDPESYGLTTEEAIEEFYTQMNMNAVYAIQGYFGIWE